LYNDAELISYLPVLVIVINESLENAVYSLQKIVVAHLVKFTA
jgi:hypothetical protein